MGADDHFVDARHHGKDGRVGDNGGVDAGMGEPSSQLLAVVPRRALGNDDLERARARCAQEALDRAGVADGQDNLAAGNKTGNKTGKRVWGPRRAPWKQKKRVRSRPGKKDASGGRGCSVPAVDVLQGVAGDDAVHALELVDEVVNLGEDEALRMCGPRQPSHMRAQRTSGRAEASAC